MAGMVRDPRRSCFVALAVPGGVPDGPTPTQTLHAASRKQAGEAETDKSLHSCAPGPNIVPGKHLRQGAWERHL